MSSSEIRRLLAVAILLSAVVAFALAMQGCAQVRSQTFIARCVAGRAPLGGELSPGTGAVLDISTSPIPFVSQPHRIAEVCDDSGNLSAVVEDANPNSLMSSLSDPFGKLLSMLTLPVL